MVSAIFPDERNVLVLAQDRHAVTDRNERRAEHRLPTAEDLRALGLELPRTVQRFTDHRGEPINGVFLDRSRLTMILDVPSKTPSGDRPQLIDRRTAPDTMDVDECTQVNRAFHLAYWDRNTVFCGACAAPMERITGEIAKRCSSCGMVSYPRISPAIIVAVVRDGRLLLAHSDRHRGDMHSVLAGFVEAGETLEHAVSREVHEECGILVRNVDYFASQPWSFPNSLMIGFTAEYAGGEISLDGRELARADWFLPQDLPREIPDTYSIARRLIEWFVSEHGTPDDLASLLTRS